MFRRLGNLASVVLMSLVLFSCDQHNQTRVNELESKITEMEQKINKLSSQNDSLRQAIASSANVSAEGGTALGSGSMQDLNQPGTQAAPSYYYGEMLTKNGNRIKVEQFGKESGSEYALCKIKGVYRDQTVEIEWQDIKRIWHINSSNSAEIELRDGRCYKIDNYYLEPGGHIIYYVIIDEITRRRSLQYCDLYSPVIIAINSKLESLNYCTNCKKYFPGIYKYCNKCGGELHYQAVRE